MFELISKYFRIMYLLDLFIDQVERGMYENEMATIAAINETMRELMREEYEVSLEIRNGFKAKGKVSKAMHYRLEFIHSPWFHFRFYRAQRALLQTAVKW